MRRGRRYDAVILAGGGSRRMGGRDKTMLAIGGAALLDRAVASVREAGRTIVVGPVRPVNGAVKWAMEDPAGSGPAAAVAAGLAYTVEAVVVLLAADLPFVSPEVVTALAAAALPAGAVVVDDAGTPQWLLSAWPREVLARAFSGDQRGRSLRGALAPLGPVEVSPAGELPAWFDCDEPGDVQEAAALWDGAVR